MEILIGLIPFALVALAWFGIERFTKFTHLDILFGLGTGLIAIAVVVWVLAMAYFIGGAILNGGTIA